MIKLEKRQKKNCDDYFIELNMVPIYSTENKFYLKTVV